MVIDCYFVPLIGDLGWLSQEYRNPPWCSSEPVADCWFSLKFMKQVSTTAVETMILNWILDRFSNLYDFSFYSSVYIVASNRAGFEFFPCFLMKLMLKIDEAFPHSYLHLFKNWLPSSTRSFFGYPTSHANLVKDWRNDVIYSHPSPWSWQHLWWHNRRLWAIFSL